MVRDELRSAAAPSGDDRRRRLLHRASTHERFVHFRFAGASQQRGRLFETMRPIQSRVRRTALPMATLGQAIRVAEMYFSNSDRSSRFGVGARLRHMRSIICLSIADKQRKN